MNFKFFLKRFLKKFTFLFALLLITIFFCEFLIFFIYISKCNWPLRYEKNLKDFNLKIIALSDVHLYGLKRGYRLDKFKREWQMYISFQISLFFFKPNLVFFLGDTFDEGLIADENEFNIYSERFKSLFSVNKNVKMIVVTGNHDVGFHDRMLYFEPLLRRRFEKKFNSSLVEKINIFGINIININSMALKRDNCFLCETANYLIDQISKKMFESCDFNSKKNNILCDKERPILLLHFPLYRSNDLDCSEPDSSYDENKKSKIFSDQDCINKISTNYLLKKLQPKLVISGHTHYGCVKTHTAHISSNYIFQVQEYTLSSFNWRFRSNPSFLLVLASRSNIKVSKCMLPNENYLFIVYLIVFLWIGFYYFKKIVFKNL